MTGHKWSVINKTQNPIVTHFKTSLSKIAMLLVEVF